MQAFGTQKTKILVSLSFAQWIQTSVKQYGLIYYYHNQVVAAYSASQNLWLPGWLKQSIVILIHYS
jgi:hypothetical protein